MSASPTGTVKWYSAEKGFGFITPDAGGDDLFVYFEHIRSPSSGPLKEGQTVSFVVARSDKGPHAEEVQVI